jgi:copper chaperone CopZ
MKTLKLILVIAILSGVCTMTYAQTTTTKTALKTETFKVYGKCEMCKSRIEKATKIDGVTSADWVIKTNLLTITYDPGKTNADILGKKLASIGHDTDKFKATDEAYAKLPECCHYDRVK